jgi:hypothetical protein
MYIDLKRASVEGTTKNCEIEIKNASSYGHHYAIDHTLRASFMEGGGGGERVRKFKLRTSFLSHFLNFEGDCCSCKKKLNLCII